MLQPQPSSAENTSKGVRMARGRPPATRARVMNYWREHGMCSNRQTANAMGTSIRHVVRIRRAVEKFELLEFCQLPTA